MVDQASSLVVDYCLACPHLRRYLCTYIFLRNPFCEFKEGLNTLCLGLGLTLARFQKWRDKCHSCKCLVHIRVFWSQIISVLWFFNNIVFSFEFNLYKYLQTQSSSSLQNLRILLLYWNILSILSYYWDFILFFKMYTIKLTWSNVKECTMAMFCSFFSL